MINFSFFFKNIDAILESAELRNIKLNISKETLYNKIKDFKTLENEINNLLFIKNSSSKENISSLLEIKRSLKEKKYIFLNLTKQLEEIFSKLPNFLISQSHENKYFSFFEGKKENKFEENKRYFSFNTNIAGTNFISFVDKAAYTLQKLETLLILHAKTFNFNLMKLPILLNKNSIEASGHANFFLHQMFKIDSQDFYLSPTSEISLLNYFRNQKIHPIKLSCFSQCFRKEAGTYGKRDKYIRFFQFSKLELFSFCETIDEETELNNLVLTGIHLLKELNLTHRICENSILDTSFHSKKTFDIEVYIPNNDSYLEISSCSTTGVFQTMQANIKSINTNEYLIALNGTCFALERLFYALLNIYSIDELDNLLSKLINEKNKL